jgi:hypothetical protein
LVVGYSTIVWGIAQLAPNNGKGETVVHNGKKYYLNIGHVQATPPVSDIQQSTLITFFIYYLTVKIE